MQIHVLPNPAAAMACRVTDDTSILVLWETIDPLAAGAIARAFPRSLTVSGDRHGRQIWGVVRRGPEIVARYQKVQGDNTNLGSGIIPPQPCVVPDPRFILGVLVCRDLDHEPVLTPTLERLRAHRGRCRILAVPADMSDGFLPGPLLHLKYDGITVALSNGRQTGDIRPSFISNRETRQIDAVQPTAAGGLVVNLSDN